MKYNPLKRPAPTCPDCRRALKIAPSGRVGVLLASLGHADHCPTLKAVTAQLAEDVERARGGSADFVRPLASIERTECVLAGIDPDDVLAVQVWIDGSDRARAFLDHIPTGLVDPADGVAP